MQPNPKFSISIPVYNSSVYLERCLKTIANQDYPQELIEILIVDAGSTDNTLDIAKKYTNRIFSNPERLGEYGMKIAVENATGDLLILFAADNGLAGTSWLKDAASVFLAHQELSCLWATMVASQDDPGIMKYYELIQSEPLAQFLNKNLKYYLRYSKEEKFNNRKYKIFRADPERPLCWGANGIVYRLADVKDIFFREGYIGDNEVFQYMLESGRTVVAYSYELPIYHHTVTSVWHWVKKWKRNYTQIFLKTRRQRRIDWFYYGNFRLKMLFWLFYSLFPVFSVLHTFYLALRDKNVYWFYHPLMCFLQTITYLFWTFVLPEGRKTLCDHLRGVKTVKCAPAS